MDVDKYCMQEAFIVLKKNTVGAITKFDKLQILLCVSVVILCGIFVLSHCK